MWIALAFVVILVSAAPAGAQRQDACMLASTGTPDCRFERGLLLGTAPKQWGGVLRVDSRCRLSLVADHASSESPVRALRDRDKATDDYRIRAEDSLMIAVWKNDAMTRAVAVRPDGKISLPLLNDVQAAGLTAVELRRVLTERLAEYFPRPEVSVIVAEMRSFQVAVFGEALRPGRYEVKSWASVLDVLRLCNERMQAPQ